MPTSFRHRWTMAVAVAIGGAPHDFIFGETPLSFQRSSVIEDVRTDCLFADRFYVVIFTAQSTPKIPRATHTFAVMVRLHANRIAELSSISWLPYDLRVKPFDLCVEPGINRCYQATLQRILCQTCQRVSMWGPYAAHPELYRRFVAQKQFLESGAVGYQCVDFLGEARIRGNGLNCIHALTPLHGQQIDGLLQPYGDDSGAFISKSLIGKGLAAPCGDLNWLLAPLGLEGLPIVRR